MADDTEKPAEISIHLLFIGLIEDVQGTFLTRWAEVDGLPNRGEPLPEDCKMRLYGPKVRPYHCQPGSIFKFKAMDDADKSIFAKSAKWVKDWQEFEQVVEWQTKSRIVETIQSSRKKDKRVSTVQRDSAKLDSFKSLYGKLNRPQRVIMLAEVIRYITDGRIEL